ncbi:CLUMA_CG018982, isoform A [Clunio marinus]|uniref:Translocon-associated protein subunit delta n=1 Tax=Clunio marinus TaxID=568069 RepID=A0A1J1J1M7_9DIPT|nr:CLUMA_CG018982, isoform A [Clunio marinus]
MNSELILLFVLSSLVVLSSCCTVKSSSYTTNDELVIANQVGYITVFTLNCKNQVNSIPLFGEVNGQIFPVFRVKDDQYQFSWTEDKQKSGNREVRLFDEEQFANYRKAQRAGETPSVEPLAAIQVKFSRSYGSNLLISSEFVVLSASLFIAYIAFQNRMKLVSN